MTLVQRPEFALRILPLFTQLLKYESCRQSFRTSEIKELVVPLASNPQLGEAAKQLLTALVEKGVSSDVGL
jgi:hypothetical protein